jgi:hypothetical protein
VQRDFSDAEVFELGWGGRGYQPRERPGSWLASRALFTPTASAPSCHPHMIEEIESGHVARNSFVHGWHNSHW